jgi:hypothetical protein
MPKTLRHIIPKQLRHIIPKATHLGLPDLASRSELASRLRIQVIWVWQLEVCLECVHDLPGSRLAGNEDQGKFRTSGMGKNGTRRLECDA